MRKKTTDELIRICRDALSEHEFPYMMIFGIPGTKNEGLLQVLKSVKDKDMFAFRVHVRRQGSQLWASHYYADRTEEDMRKYLASDEDEAKIRKSIDELSARIDDKEGEFPSDY